MRRDGRAKSLSQRRSQCWLSAQSYHKPNVCFRPKAATSIGVRFPHLRLGKRRSEMGITGVSLSFHRSIGSNALGISACRTTFLAEVPPADVPLQPGVFASGSFSTQSCHKPIAATRLGPSLASAPNEAVDQPFSIAFDQGGRYQPVDLEIGLHQTALQYPGHDNVCPFAGHSHVSSFQA